HRFYGLRSVSLLFAPQPAPLPALAESGQAPMAEALAVRQRVRDPAVGVNRTGIDLTPRIQFERTRTTGPASSRSGSRRRSSSKATRVSRRESDAPRQKCPPPPKER